MEYKKAHCLSGSNIQGKKSGSRIGYQTIGQPREGRPEVSKSGGRRAGSPREKTRRQSQSSATKSGLEAKKLGRSTACFEYAKSGRMRSGVQRISSGHKRDAIFQDESQRIEIRKCIKSGKNAVQQGDKHSRRTFKIRKQHNGKRTSASILKNTRQSLRRKIRRNYQEAEIDRKRVCQRGGIAASRHEEQERSMAEEKPGRRMLNIGRKQAIFPLLPFPSLSTD